MDIRSSSKAKSIWNIVYYTAFSPII